MSSRSSVPTLYLRRVAKVSSGKSPPSGFSKHEGTFVVYGSNGPIGFSPEFLRTEQTLIVGRVGACGAVNVAPPLSWISDNALIVDLMPGTSLEFVRHALAVVDYTPFISTTAQPLLTGADVSVIRIWLPPLEEQTQIAKFLDYETAKMDALIEKQQQLIALLKEKRQAVISHAVTEGLDPDVPMRDSGVEWLGEVPAHWTIAALKYYSRLVDCKHITAEFVDDGYPLASIGEVKGWYVDLTSAKRTTKLFYKALVEGGRRPQTGDIIYTRNATVGEASLVGKDLPPFAMGQDVCLIRPSSSTESPFLLHCLKSSVVGSQLDLAMVGSTFKRVNVEAIRNFVVAFPPAREQVLIVAELSKHLSTFDELIGTAETTVDLLQERRTALISAAVTGKIDVRNWKAPESSTATETP